MRAVLTMLPAHTVLAFLASPHVMYLLALTVFAHVTVTQYCLPVSIISLGVLLSHCVMLLQVARWMTL